MRFLLLAYGQEMGHQVPYPLIKELLDEYFSPDNIYRAEQFLIDIASKINRLGIGTLNFNEESRPSYYRFNYEISSSPISKENLWSLLEILKELIEYSASFQVDELMICREAAIINSILEKAQIKLGLVPVKSSIGYSLKIREFL